MSGVPSVSSKPEFVIRITGSIPLEPRYFFDDSLTNDHENSTELDCAREVARYIDEHGLSNWLREWNLDDIDVYVGKYPAALQGVTITVGSDGE